MGIYVKCRRRWIGWLLDLETTRGSYGGLNLLGVSSPSGEAKMSTWLQQW